MPLKHTLHELKLENGVQGLLINVPGATAIHYSIDFRAGNFYAKNPAISQVAHIMEHLAFGANDEYGSQEDFSQEFTKNGAYNNAWTGSVDMIYSADAARMEWDRILDLQELAITKPRYSAETLNKEKGNVREELVGYANNHYRILWQLIMKRSGLSRWFDADELKTIDTVSIEDVKEHFDSTHTLDNMRFIFAGDLLEYREEIESRLSKWQLPSGTRFAIPIDEPKPTGLVHVRRDDLANATFSIHFFIRRELKRGEVTTMATVGHILTDTLHSRILGVARSRGICYSMNSGINSSSSDISELSFSGQVSKENAEELFALIADQLRDIARNGVTAEELASAKEYRLGSMQMGTETVGSLVGWYSDYYFEEGIVDDIGRMPDLINETTNNDIKILVREFAESDIWTLGCIGNISSERAQELYDLFAKKMGKG